MDLPFLPSSAFVKKPGSIVAFSVVMMLCLLARRADSTRGLYVSPGCVATIAEDGTY
jgi:hypothetical protein